MREQSLGLKISVGVEAELLVRLGASSVDLLHVLVAVRVHCDTLVNLCLLLLFHHEMFLSQMYQDLANELFLIPGFQVALTKQCSPHLTFLPDP